MTNKPVLFLDNDFLIKTHKAAGKDEATFHRILDGYAKDYDVRITDVVKGEAVKLNETDASGQPYPKDVAVDNWLTQNNINNTITNIDPNVDNAGEKSIVEAIKNDPDLYDDSTGTAKAGTFEIASNDKGFLASSGDPDPAPQADRDLFEAGKKNAQDLAKEQTVKGNVSLEDYKTLSENSQISTEPFEDHKLVTKATIEARNSVDVDVKENVDGSADYTTTKDTHSVTISETDLFGGETTESINVIYDDGLNGPTSKVLSNLGKYGSAIDKAGYVGDVIGIGLAITESGIAYANGDTRGAGKILAEAVAELGGGAAVGTVAASAVGAGLLAAGAPVAAVGGAFIAGLAGGYYGGKAAGELVKDIYDDVADMGLVPYLDGIADDYGWAFDNPVPVLRELLPPWLADKVLPQTETPRNEASPLVLDLGEAGIDLVSVDSANAVYWDLDQDGMAEMTGWVGSEDGLLALDRNGDGIINDHSELFGTEAIDGFVMLAELDSNGDSIIDSNDTAFNDLIVWVDTNQDGYSQGVELYTLNDLGIASIDLNFDVVDYDIAGNAIRSESTYAMTDGTSRTVVDAWFTYDNVNSVYAQDYTLDVRTLFLPTLRGYGQMADLHIAMSLDNAEGGLLNMVQEVATTNLETLFSSSFNLENKIKEILFTWAGVEDVDPNGRGSHVDGRELAFLEALTDRPFEQRGSANPWTEAGQTLENAFNDAYNALSARLLVQSAGARQLFIEIATYNPQSDTFEGTFLADLTAIYSTIDALELSGSGLTEAWNSMIRLIDHTVGLDNLSSGDMAALETMITDSDPASTLTLQDVLDTIYEPVGLGLNGTEGDDTLIGGAGNDNLSTSGGDDVIYGRQGNDSINGGTGNDNLYGEEGHDNIAGGNGDDYLAGGIGDDTLQGGFGNDTYYYETGIDTIRETSGYDTIIFDSAITPAQISIDFSETNRNDIYIYVDGLLAIRVENYFSHNGGAVEYLSFSDGTIIELSELTGLTEGSAGDDTLVGNDSAAFPHDTLSGLEGNDTLDGGIGNDILKGGRGDDTYLISAGTDVVGDTAGTDKIIFGAGLNSTDVSYEVGSDGDMYISFNGTRYATIENQFTSQGSIETFEFGDGVSVQASDLRFDQNGTSSADTIYGYRYGVNIENTIYAGAGNDRIYAYSGDDKVYGEGGNDRIYASSGDDTLDGGAGDDYLDGSTGNDTYIVTAGVDTISDSGGIDKIIFGSAYDVVDMTFGRSGSSGNDLNIYFDNVLATTVSYHLGSSDSIETLEFSDSSTFSLASYVNIKGQYGSNDILNGVDDTYFEDDYIFGYSGNDTLNGGVGDDKLYGGADNDTLIGGVGNDFLGGGSGDDTLDGGAGDDYLDGGSGEDIYIYSGAGDTFHDNGFKDETDVISFGAGISSGNISFTRMGRYDLQININGNNAILIENQFNDYDQIEALSFGDGSSLNLLDVVYTTDGTEDRETIYGTNAGAKSDILNGYGGDDRLYAYSGDDILDGGLGEDDLYGGSGNDTYLITDAGDWIRDESGIDKVVFDASYNIDNLELARSGSNDLIISFNGAPTLTISNQFDEYDQIETLEFSDGSAFDLLTQSYSVNGDASNNYIYGISYGGNPDDTLSGGEGNDTLYGYLGNDVLNGGSGDDNLYGGDGNDSYYVGAGVDTISDTGGNDTIYLDAGFVSDDMTYERSGSYNLDIYFNAEKKLTLLNHLKSSSVIETLVFSDGSTIDLSSLAFVSAGTENNDTLYGSDSPGSFDEIDGLAGNDRIYGYAGDDTLIGGTGNDTLYGGSGDDIYIIHSGDGADTISENANEGTDTIHLTGGVVADNIRLWTDTSGDLHIENEITGDTVKVYAGESNTNGSNQSLIGQHVEQIVFDDGTIWDLTDGLNIEGTASSDTLYGTVQDDKVFGYDGNDRLYGNGGADTINGGTGNDTLYGGHGDDGYVFKAGDGSDTISENANEGTNSIYLKGGIKANDVRLWTDTGGDLHVENKVTGDTIEVYAGESNTGGSNQSLIKEHMAQIIFDDGTIWDLTSGLNLDGSNNAETLYGTSYDDIVSGHDGNDYIYGNSGNDTLSGGLGNDTLYGGLGDDFYIIYANNGTDIISENIGEGIDTIHFVGGILPDDLRLWTDASGDLRIVNKVTGGQIEIYAGESNTGGSNQSLIGQHIEKITFDNGVVWDLTQALNIEGSIAADTLYGTAMGDTIAGMQGNDHIYGNSGNDVIYGNKGNDTLYGGLGDDTYIFHIGSGSDTISENANQGTNIIRLSGGISAQNVRLWTDTGGDLHVENKVTGDTIEVYAGESNTGGSNQSLIKEHMAQIIFDDGTIWDLTSGLNLDGSNNAETLYGTSYDDIVSGHDGNDYIYGNSGNDILDGGAGNDDLYGGAGDDIFIYTVAENAGYDDYYNGESGADVLKIYLSSALANSPLFQADLNAYNDWVTTFDETSGTTYNDFTFQSFGLTLDAIERVELIETGTSFLDFTHYTLSGYSDQDSNPVSVTFSDPYTFELSGNSWKKLDFEYTVTADTVLKFEFKSDQAGEIHGIGLDNNNAHSANGHIQILGSQIYGLDGPNYTGAGAWQSFELNLADYYASGYEASYLTFVNDDDTNATANSWFRNIEIFEPEADQPDPDSGNGNDSGAIPSLEIDVTALQSYAGQDTSPVVVEAPDQQTLHITGNTWKKLDFEYTVTSDTVLKFEFKSDQAGEIHGIGLDNNNAHSANGHIQILGSQIYGLDGPNYTGAGAWQSFELNLADYYASGYEASYLTFINDDDTNATANSWFRNIRIYEEGDTFANIISINEPDITQPSLDISNIDSYSSQDGSGQMTNAPDGSLVLQGNSWKKLDLGYTITEDTELFFRFRSEHEGEVHGIGFDTDHGYSASDHIQIYGTQDYGLNGPSYTGNGAWQDFSIDVSDYFGVGETVSYLTFINDMDAAGPAHGQFADVTLYENPVFTGTAASDIFDINTALPGNAPYQIDGFDTALDRLDIADIIDFDPANDLITEFLQVTDNGTDTQIAVDPDGGGDGFQTIATLYGVTGLTDEAALYSNSTLIAT